VAFRVGLTAMTDLDSYIAALRRMDRRDQRAHVAGN
jgi:hypothetical protein